MSFWVSGIRFNITSEGMRVGQPLLAVPAQSGQGLRGQPGVAVMPRAQESFWYDDIVDFEGSV